MVIFHSYVGLPKGYMFIPNDLGNTWEQNGNILEIEISMNSIVDILYHIILEVVYTNRNAKEINKDNIKLCLVKWHITKTRYTSAT